MAAPAAVTAIDFFCSPFMLGFWGIGAIGCGLLGPWIYHIDQHPGKRQEFQDVNSTATYLAMMEMAPNQTEISAALQGYHAPMFMLEKGGNYYIGINPSVDKVFAQAVNDATLFLWKNNSTWYNQPITNKQQAKDRMDQVLAIVPNAGSFTTASLSSLENIPRI